MSITKGYGVVVCNVASTEESTIAFRQLVSVGFDESDIVVDIIRQDMRSRPKLNYLISNLSKGDRIVMYSVDTLLQGYNKKSAEYYSAILDKGIDLLIFDFSGAVAKISPFSTLRLGDKLKGEASLVKKDIPHDVMVANFCRYLQSANRYKNSGKRKTEKRLNINDAFKEIYFAYESYQIDQATTLSLLSEFCDIKDIAMFWRMAQDYERMFSYANDLNEYAKITPEILLLPKRCGGLPKEYSKILELVTAVKCASCDYPHIEVAMRQLGVVGDYQVFKRWELVAQNKPKPRKPVVYDFSITEFKKKYQIL